MAVLLIFLLGLGAGSTVAFVVLGLAEFVFRGGNWKRVGQAVLPFLYLSLGIQISFIFSGIIVCLRPCTLYDAALNNLDKHIMFGLTVNSLSHTFYSLYPVAEWVYYGLFGIIGAALLLLCLFGDRKAAMQMSGTILIAYFMSLTVFYFIPALGPFVEGDFPRQTFTATAQQGSLEYARLLYHHSQWIPLLAKNYFVAFPSLHLAQPVIAAWFLRRWKRVSLVIVAYCILVGPIHSDSSLALSRRYHRRSDCGCSCHRHNFFFGLRCGESPDIRTSQLMGRRLTKPEPIQARQISLPPQFLEKRRSTIRTHRLGMVDENLPCSILTARAGLLDRCVPSWSPSYFLGAVDDPTV